MSTMYHHVPSCTMIHLGRGPWELPQRRWRSPGRWGPRCNTGTPGSRAHGMATLALEDALRFSGWRKSSVEKAFGFQKNRKRRNDGNALESAKQILPRFEPNDFIVQIMSKCFTLSCFWTTTNSLGKSLFRVTTWMTACKFEVQGCGQWCLSDVGCSQIKSKYHLCNTLCQHKNYAMC